MSLNRWTTDNHLVFDEHECADSVIARWHKVVAHIPTHPAIVTDDLTLSYAQVDHRAAQIAHALPVAERPDTLIALLFDHGSNAILALLGVLKTDRAYVALNATLPPSTLGAQLADSLATVIVTDQAHLAIAQELATEEQQIINVDMLDLATSNVSTANVSATNGSVMMPLPKPQRAGDDLLAVLYTSGSSGVPKGVMLPHNHLMHIARRGAWYQHYNFDDRIALIYEWSYAMGTVITFSTLLNGSTLCLSDAVKQDNTAIPRWVAAEQITVLNLPIPLFRYLAQNDAVTHDSMGEQLAIISVGGMKLAWDDVTDFVRRYGCTQAQIEFGYGMTEAGWVSDHWLPLQSPHGQNGSILAGTAALDKELLILDEQRQPLPVNQVGEVAVRSHFMAQGYWQQADLTALQFWTDETGKRVYASGDMGRVHENGQLEILGRKDSMVKVRGYRVELSSIEIALQQLASVSEAAVIAPEQTDGDRRLIAYLVTAQPPPSQREIRLQLRDKLAAHEIPSQFVFLASLPHTMSGKLDRKALPVPEKREPPSTNYVAPRTPLETTLVTLWREVLAVEKIGIHDNFFELGGHSLHAMTVMAKVESQFGARPSLDLFFIEPTVERLARLLGDEATQRPAAATFAAMGLSSTQANAMQKLSVQLSDLNQLQDWQKVGAAMNWHRRRKAIALVFQALPYTLTRRLLQQLASSASWRQRFFADKATLTEEFLALVTSDQDKRAMLPPTFLCNLLHYYQIAPRQSARVQQPRAKHIEGMAHIEAAQANGKGIILVGYHDTACLQQDEPALRPKVTVGGLQHYLAHHKIDNAMLANSLFSQQLNSARQVLQDKGMILIIPDGHHGYSNGMPVGFCGRRRRFHTSFAELALLTDAAVIAMIREMDKEGKATIRLVGTLDTGNESSSHNERVERLVSQYVALLRSIWAERPWMVPWYQMERHMAYPPCEG